MGCLYKEVTGPGGFPREQVPRPSNWLGCTHRWSIMCMTESMRTLISMMVFNTDSFISAVDMRGTHIANKHWSSAESRGWCTWAAIAIGTRARHHHSSGYWNYWIAASKKGISSYRSKVSFNQSGWAEPNHALDWLKTVFEPDSTSRSASSIENSDNFPSLSYSFALLWKISVRRTISPVFSEQWSNVFHPGWKHRFWAYAKELYGLYEKEIPR